MNEPDIIEGMIRGMIHQGVSPCAILVGIHNAFVHGDCLISEGLYVSDQSLQQLFDGFEMSMQAMKDIVEEND